MVASSDNMKSQNEWMEGWNGYANVCCMQNFSYKLRFLFVNVQNTLKGCQGQTKGTMALRKHCVVNLEYLTRMLQCKEFCCKIGKKQLPIYGWVEVMACILSIYEISAMTNGPGSSFRILQTTSKTLYERSFEVEVQKFHAKFATKVPTQSGKQHKNEVRKAHGKTTADLSLIYKNNSRSCVQRSESSQALLQDRPLLYSSKWSETQLP